MCREHLAASALLRITVCGYGEGASHTNSVATIKGSKAALPRSPYQTAGYTHLSRFDCNKSNRSACASALAAASNRTVNTLRKTVIVNQLRLRALGSDVPNPLLDPAPQFATTIVQLG